MQEEPQKRHDDDVSDGVSDSSDDEQLHERLDKVNKLEKEMVSLPADSNEPQKPRFITRSAAFRRENQEYRKPDLHKANHNMKVWR